MTVVARGAAIYAATVELAKEAASPRQQATEVVQMKLAHEPVSAESRTTVAGRVLDNPGRHQLEVRFESKAGYWSSGWLLIKDDYFEVDVMLQEGKLCPFFVYVRSANGDALEVEPSEFTIRHGMELSAPPLPHTISVEVVRPSGRIELDAVFPRNTPLPAEKQIQYRADRTLRPGESGTILAVKLWEGEDLSDPEANEWVGNAQITSSMIRRPIPENSEIELLLKIDKSRLITVDIFVPHLNQYFSEGVYIAEREQQSEADAATRLMRDITTLTDRLVVLHDHIDQQPNSDTAAAVVSLRRQVEDFDILVTSIAQQDSTKDPEESHRLIATGRDLRTQIATLERKAGIDRVVRQQSLAAQATLTRAMEVVEKCGEKIDKFEFEMLRKELDLAADRQDERGVAKYVSDLDALQFRVLSRHDWFWRDIFETMNKDGSAFKNASAAQQWVGEGERAIRQGDGALLREAVQRLWALQPPSSVEAAKQKALRTGLRA